MVYPACAGIDRIQGCTRGIEQCLPRMRGDRPLRLYRFLLKMGFTPHARGSTVGEDYTDRLITVYPACAGIDLVQPPQL